MIAQEMPASAGKRFISSPRSRTTLIIAAVITVVLGVVSLGLGRYGISPFLVIKILAARVFPITQSWPDVMESVIFNVRLPRIIGALLVGGCLSLSGTVYQGCFRNPLVSPDLLGVSSGASIGAALFILLGKSGFYIQLGALVFGIAAVVITISISRVFKTNTILMLVLSGIIVNGVLSSILSIIKFTADPEETLPEIVFWLMGSLGSVKFDRMIMVLPGIIICTGILLAVRWRINILSLGEKEAKALGVNLKRMQTLTIFCSTYLTAAAVCMAGTIGWIGLVIPHLGRLMIGSDNKYLVPLSIFLGASFMIVVDNIARNVTGVEIPLRAITGLIGAPVFGYLLYRQRMNT